MNEIRVMVTGSGSGVGQGIIKSLRLSELPIKIIVADIDRYNAGFYTGDESVIIPKLENLTNCDQMINLLSEKDIDVLMVGSEYDLEFFAKFKNQIEEKLLTKVIVSSQSSVKIANDKYLTACFLKENEIAVSDFWAPQNLDEAINIYTNYGKPMILKSRTGTSNRNVFLVETAKKLKSLFNQVPNPMLQEVLAYSSEKLDSEYTCSIFKCFDGTILGPFTSRRTLKSGNSWVIEVDNFKEIYPMLLNIGEKFPTIGSLNIQLMMTEKGPIPFEFNSRFSGTTAVRSHFGFNEPEMAIRNYYLNENIKNPKIRSGVVFKYLEEVFIDDIKYKDLNSFKGNGLINKWF